MTEQTVDICNKNLSYILAIAEFGSIRAASEKLFISQPALSRFVKSLENRIDLALFERIDNRLVLTAAGHMFIDYARQVSSIEKSLISDIVHLQNENKSQIRVGIPDHWAPYIIPRLVINVENNFPQVRLEIIDVNSMTLENLLLDNSVDLIISRYPSNKPSITSIFLHEDQIYLAVPSKIAYGLRTSELNEFGMHTIDLTELQNLIYILPNPGQSLRNFADELFFDLNVKPNIRMLCRSVEASMRLVGNGLGCCFISSTHKRHVDVIPTPSYFAIAHPSATLPLHISFLTGRKLPQHISLFMDQLKNIL